MDDPKTFEALCRAMSDPGFYPHPVSKLERRDSHISAVFLTGPWAYKLKKPLDFGFLDYRGLENRRRMCEREVVLNQRLSRGVYQGVVAIAGGREGFRLDDEGEAVEFAVKMKQLPDDGSLASLLGAGGASPYDMSRLGVRLARFYAGSGHDEKIDRFGSPEIIGYNTEENFRQLSPFVGILIKKDPFDFIRESSRGYFRKSGRLFQRRIEEGRIRDGHGDLRAEHVYFLDEIQIIDCIEFNDRFRYGDVAADLGFLHMDVERLGRADLSLAMLSGYLEASGDYGIYSVLDFYACYRAIVKMKVACLSWTELEECGRKEEMEARAARYLELAFRYAVELSRPALWIVCGLPGTGKSTFAERIRDIFDISLFQSDRLRRELPEYGEHTGPVRFGEGIYKPALRGRVYGLLLARAQEELKKGASVVLDATFSSRKWRGEAVRLAEDLDASLFFVECACGKAVMLERLGRRRNVADSFSDARPEHLGDFLERFEEMSELPAEFHTRIDTEREVNENLGEMLSKTYAMRRAQIERAIKKL